MTPKPRLAAGAQVGYPRWIVYDLEDSTLWAALTGWLYQRQAKVISRNLATYLTRPVGLVMEHHAGARGNPKTLVHAGMAQNATYHLLSGRGAPLADLYVGKAWATRVARVFATIYGEPVALHEHVRGAADIWHEPNERIGNPGVKPQVGEIWRRRGGGRVEIKEVDDARVVTTSLSTGNRDYWHDPLDFAAKHELVGRRRNPKGRNLSVPEQHQLKIARQTLKYSDAGARIMGGPSKAEAREIIYRLTGQWPKENPKPGHQTIKAAIAALLRAAGYNALGRDVKAGRARPDIGLKYALEIEKRPKQHAILAEAMKRLRSIGAAKLAGKRPSLNPARPKTQQYQDGEHDGMITALEGHPIPPFIAKGTSDYDLGFKAAYKRTGQGPNPNPKGRNQGDPLCLGQVRTRTAVQEWYETGSRHAGIRARQLRALGYKVGVEGMGSQVTPLGLLNMTLLTVHGGDLENLPPVRCERMGNPCRTPNPKGRKARQNSYQANYYVTAQAAGRGSGMVTWYIGLAHIGPNRYGWTSRRDEAELLTWPQAQRIARTHAEPRFPEPEIVSAYQAGANPGRTRNPGRPNPLSRWVDRRSIRSVRSGKTLVRVGCPKGHFHPRARGRKCDVGTRALEVLTNPSELARGVKTFRKWHANEPHRLSRVKAPSRVPGTMVKLGELESLVYRSNKWAGGSDNPQGKALLYEHETKRPRPVLATDPDGRDVFIVGGKMRVTAGGLVN